MGYHVGKCGSKTYGFSAVLVITRLSILAISGSQIEYGFYTVVLNRVCFLEEAAFSPLLIRPSTIAFYNALNIGLN